MLNGQEKKSMNLLFLWLITQIIVTMIAYKTREIILTDHYGNRSLCLNTFECISKVEPHCLFTSDSYKSGKVSTTLSHTAHSAFISSHVLNYTKSTNQSFAFIVLSVALEAWNNPSWNSCHIFYYQIFDLWVVWEVLLWAVNRKENMQRKLHNAYFLHVQGKLEIFSEAPQLGNYHLIICFPPTAIFLIFSNIDILFLTISKRLHRMLFVIHIKFHCLIKWISKRKKCV